MESLHPPDGWEDDFGKFAEFIFGPHHPKPAYWKYVALAEIWVDLKNKKPLRPEIKKILDERFEYIKPGLLFLKDY